MKEWQKFSSIFKDLLKLDTSPVAISCLQKPLPEKTDEKVRICRGILKAAKNGEILQISRDNNACFGAAWHLGFIQVPKGSKVEGMIKKFVVEGEKLFSSYAALDNLIAQMKDVPNNAGASFLLSPLERAEVRPEIVMFVCNAEAACRLLTLVTFSDGKMPQIKIGGPTCRMAIVEPLLTGEVNISFYDYTARKMCNVEKDKLLVSIPYRKIPQIVENIDKCTAGSARIEYPQEFREFLQKRLAK